MDRTRRVLWNYKNRPRSSAVGTGQLAYRPASRYRIAATTPYPQSRIGNGTHPSNTPNQLHGRGSASSIVTTASDRLSTRSCAVPASITTKIDPGASGSNPCRTSNPDTWLEGANRSRS